MATAKPRKTWVYVTLGSVMGLTVLAFGVFVISRAISDMGQSDGGAQASQMCIGRLRKLAQAQLLYAAAHDDRLPAAEKWMDESWSFGPGKAPKDPAQEGEGIFRCPTVSVRRDGSYGFAFHSELGRASVSQVSRPSESALVFDSSDVSRNAAGSPEDLLPRPGRHERTRFNNVATVDGAAARRPAP